VCVCEALKPRPVDCKSSNPQISFMCQSANREFAGFFGSSHFNSAPSELCGLSFYQMAKLQRKKKPKHNKETQITYFVFMSAKKSGPLNAKPEIAIKDGVRKSIDLTSFVSTQICGFAIFSEISCQLHILYLHDFIPPALCKEHVQYTFLESV
jgi:hypothetical protein